MIEIVMEGVALMVRIGPRTRSHWQEGNIVDIGLFDPRGAEFLTAKGFRGWSGGSLQAFTVAADEATPGYLAGPVQAGTWHVTLGLHQLAPEGCDYRVVVVIEPPEVPLVEEPAALMARALGNPIIYPTDTGTACAASASLAPPPSMCYNQG